MSPVRFIFVVAFVFLLRSAFSQSNEMCVYARDPDKYHDSILKALNTKVVKRDSLSYIVIDGKYYQRDSSKIILPDSCTLVVSYYLQYAYTDSPKLNYLILLDKIGSFNEGMANESVWRVTQELALTPSFISMLSEHQELSNIYKQFINGIAYSEFDSEYFLKIKKWLKQNSAKKDTEFYKKVSATVQEKK